MREPPKIPEDPKDIEKNTKYDILVSDKEHGGDHDETDQPICRGNAAWKD